MHNVIKQTHQSVQQQALLNASRRLKRMYDLYNHYFRSVRQNVDCLEIPISAKKKTFLQV